MNETGKIFKLNEILELDVPEPSFIWEDFISKEEVNIVVGAPNAGKSPIVLALIFHIINEKEFLNRKTKHTNVLLIDEESSLPLIVSRIKRLNKTITNYSKKNQLHVFWSKGFKLVPVDLNKLKEYCKKNEIDVVVVDSFLRITTGKENESEYIAQIFSMLKPLCDELGLTIIFIHHTVKTANSIKMTDIRGSGDLAAMAGSIIGVTAKPNNQIEIKHLKNRHGELSNSVLCKIIDKETPTGAGLAVELVGEVSNEMNFDKMIFNWIKNNFNQGDFFKSGLIYNQFSNIPKNQVLKSLNNLASEQKLLGDGKGKWVLKTKNGDDKNEQEK